MSIGVHIGTVVGNTSPQEFRFFLKSYRAKLGDLVSVEMEIPSPDGRTTDPVSVWGRIVELGRFQSLSYLQKQVRSWQKRDSSCSIPCCRSLETR